MTDEEVLDWLYRIRSCVEIYFPYRWINKCQEALDYAISKLKGESRMDKIFKVGDFPNTFAQQGWQCPICGRVYSPTTIMCFYCGNQKTALTIEKTYKIDYAPDHGTTSGIDCIKMN